MSAVQNIRAKSAASSQKARATASADDDAEDGSLAPDEPVDGVPAEPAPPPPGMGKLVDKTA